MNCDSQLQLKKIIPVW